MATASATISPATIRAAIVVSPASSSPSRRRSRVKYINGFNPFVGLRANNIVTSLGLPVSSETAFAKIVCSLKQDRRRGGGGGGALGARCSAVAEIFKIAATMNGLVLVGVAVGFVLLKMEAIVEESE